MATIIEAIYPYTYTDDNGLEIAFREGDRFILMEKSSEDWWKVQRTGVFSGKSICFVPASYMEEKHFTPPGDRPPNHYVNLSVFQKIVAKDADGLAKLSQQSLVVSKDDDSFDSNPDDEFVSPVDVVSPSLENKTLDGSKSKTLPSGWKKYRDSCGRSFYYNEDNNESTWKPPRLSRNYDDKEESEDVFLTEESFRERRQSCDDFLRRRSENKFSESSNVDSQNRMSHGSFSPECNNSYQTPTKSTSYRQSYDPNCTSSNKEGMLHRQKLYEGNKFVKKPSWQQVYCSIIGSSMVFYKDVKTASMKSGYPTGKPESSLDLRGAILDPVSKEKAGGKKHVFQVTSYGKHCIQQFSADNEIEMGQWVKVIHMLIQQLEKEDPLPVDLSSNFKFDGPKNLRSDGVTKSHGTLPPRPLSRTSTEKEKGFFRKFTTKGNHDTNDEDKEKMKIKDKLKKYLVHRPTYGELEAKGIVKDFVFGCSLQKLCKREGTLIPKCIVQIITEVERRGLQIDGIYRVSGNLSMVQKFRVMVDHGELVDFRHPTWSDTHLLTGSLKLYFRELPEPLIPFSLFERFIDAMKVPSRVEKLRKIKELISLMPRENMETFQFLIFHLQRVASFSSKNRMDIQNLAIVFGPTLLWPENSMTYFGVTTIYQSRVIEFLLLECNNVFHNYSST